MLLPRRLYVLSLGDTVIIRKLIVNDLLSDRVVYWNEILYNEIWVNCLGHDPPHSFDERIYIF